jgi:hypothetical protein
MILSIVDAAISVVQDAVGRNSQRTLSLKGICLEAFLNEER